MFEEEKGHVPGSVYLGPDARGMSARNKLVRGYVVGQTDEGDQWQAAGLTSEQIHRLQRMKMNRSSRTGNLSNL